MTRLPRPLEALARMLTYMLRHRPDEFGLVLSDEGFIPLKQLQQALTGEPGWGFVRRRHLEELAALLSPPRFEVQGELIRGLGPPPARRHGKAPPALLFLGIPPKAHERVWEEGLKAKPGQDLVLATTQEMARRLGKRRAPEPVLVTVQAQAAVRAGVPFQGYGEQLFLAAAVPREFLQLPTPLPQKREKPKAEKAPEPIPTPGALYVDLPQFFHQAAKTRKRDEPAWKTGTRALRQKRRRGKK